jgi:hypothetical protein
MADAGAFLFSVLFSRIMREGDRIAQEATELQRFDAYLPTTMVLTEIIYVR